MDVPNVSCEQKLRVVFAVVIIVNLAKFMRLNKITIFFIQVFFQPQLSSIVMITKLYFLL
jgi:hypothetical protein